MVVLVMVALLALLAAGFAFMVHANLNTVLAEQQRFRARMAAESGVQRAIVALMRDPDDPAKSNDLDRWFDNPDEFWGGVVSGGEGNERSLGQEGLRSRTSEEATYDPNADAVWRFSLVATNYDDPETVRYGITDECSKLDLNRATESQLRRLFQSVIPQDSENPVDINVLVDSLLDWRGDVAEGVPAGQPRPNGAKDAYYLTLDPPYRCKNGPFATVEELLLVRGFTGWVLFGEDYNRNGLLDEAEDDGDETFPPDNADGRLFPGVAPFLTVWSIETNTANDNKPRINLNLQDTEKLQEKLTEYFDGQIISYIMEVRASGKTFNSVMNLLPAPPTPEEEPAESPPDPTTLPSGEPSTSQPGDDSDGNSGDGESNSADQQSPPTRSENQQPTSQPVYSNLTEAEPPGTYETLPLILDRLTTDLRTEIRGRINVSTAPREVLAMIDGLTEEELDAIVAVRRELSGEEKSTPAWLVTKGVLDEYKFRGILDKITAKSAVYHVQSLGYADNSGVVERLSVVVKMQGPIPQVLYYRNLTSLGPAYRPHGEERRDTKSAG